MDEQLGLNTGAVLGDALFGAAGVQKNKGDVYVDKYVGACPWYKYPTAWEMTEHEQQRIAQLRKTADDQMAALAATTTGVLHIVLRWLRSVGEQVQLVTVCSSGGLWGAARLILLHIHLATRITQSVSSERVVLVIVEVIAGGVKVDARRRM